MVNNSPQCPKTAPPLIVIDPGHGNYRLYDGTEVQDPGTSQIVRGVRVTEQSINWRAAQVLKTELERAGFEVMLTRNSEGEVLPDRFQSRLDVGRGRKVMQIALHADHSRHPNMRGLNAYFYHGDDPVLPAPHSQGLAQAIQSAFGGQEALTTNSSILQPGRFVLTDARGRRPRGDINFDVRRGLENVPGVLVEVGFMSNRADLDELMNDTALRSRMWHLASTVSHYYHSQMEPERRMERAQRAADTHVDRDIVSQIMHFFGAHNTQTQTRPPCQGTSSRGDRPPVR